MKWTYDWLTQYLDTTASATEIADTLTRIGLEVEDLIAPIAPIAAKIVKCDAHENSDHLHILQVDDGTGTLRQVVCGAPNARVGLVSALAVPGCVIDGHEIQSGKLRGVVSNGMMCSARELGIGDDHSGIIELDDSVVPGTPVIAPSIVFDAGITPNRPDYLSVRGIARDLSAAGVGKYVAASESELPEKTGNRTVIINTDKCPVYRMCEIHNITMSSSSDVISTRLRAIGINPKNAAIDATNYICYDMAQPMHCFDADQVQGNITVRMAESGEQFTDLFGNEHKLSDTDIVITDDAGILALAGVIGGARASTTDTTKNIILESAYFDPVSVRKTSKRLGISTDASYRYERGIDPSITGIALAQAAKIITDTCGGDIVATVTSGKNPVRNISIKYNPNLFLQKTGVEMSSDIQHKILTALGYSVDITSDTWSVVPPHARVDVEIPETVVADLLRIYGYDKIAESATHLIDDNAPHNDCGMQLKRKLASRGLNECRSFGFGNSQTEQLLSDKPSLQISNPITSDLDTLRNGLLCGLLTAVSNNEKRGYPDLNLFELGTVFDGDTPGGQHNQLCIVRTGTTAPRHWTGRNRDVDVYDVKSDLMSLIAGQRFTIDSENAPLWAHPYRYGAIMQGKRKIAEFGELYPSVAKKLRIKTRTVIAIVDDVTVLPTARRGKEVALSDFQPITRDFAFIVDVDTPAEKLVSVAMSTDARITDVVVFDAFDMGNGKKSIAFTITIQPTDNMTDSDLMSIQNSVIGAVEKKCGAQIRDK